MKKSLINSCICATFAVSTLCSTSSFATNGYSSHGFGTKSKAMAGVGAALPLSTMTVATNPAGAVLMGDRMDFGLALMLPSRSFTANNDGSPVGPPMGPPSIVAGTYESGKDYFFIPHFGYNKTLDNQSSIGVSIGGNGGMNTKYNKDVFAPFNNPYFGTQASTPTGVDLNQLFVGFPYSKKLNARHSIGIMPILAVQSFEAYGLEPFKPFSKHPNHLTNNGHDISYGGGIRVGWLGQLTDKFSLGASYQSRLMMTEFDDYKGLFSESGDFDIPSIFNAGFAFKATPQLTLAFDVQHIRYSEIKALHNQHDLSFFDYSSGQPMPRTLLGTDNGIGFGWDDMTIAKLGIAYDYSTDLTLRAGYSKANQIIPSSQGLFNILAPAVITEHVSFGFTKNVSKNSEFNVAVSYAFKDDVGGTNPNTGPQTGEIEMEQWEVEISWGMRF